MVIEVSTNVTRFHHGLILTSLNPNRTIGIYPIALYEIFSREDHSLSNQTPFETEIAQLLVTTLNLKVEPGEISPLDPLFGEGLGLDSIDALEIALVVHQHFGYKLRSDDPDNTTIFSSLRSLCEAIQKNRTIP